VNTEPSPRRPGSSSLAVGIAGQLRGSNNPRSRETRLLPGPRDHAHGPGAGRGHLDLGRCRIQVPPAPRSGAVLFAVN
jgi:hypothetical protein